MSLPHSDSEIDELVAQYPLATQALIAQSRRLIRTTLPGVTETADRKARLLGYGYGPGYKGVVATLILGQTNARIGIPYGATLPDPSGLLVGTGKVHRGILVKSHSDLSSPALGEMLKMALQAWKQRTRDNA